MKTTCLSVAAIAAALALPFGAAAASQATAPEQGGSAVQAPAASDTPAVRRHSHMSEKIGVRAEQTAPGTATVAKRAPARDATNRHNHQRDFK